MICNNKHNDEDNNNNSNSSSEWACFSRVMHFQPYNHAEAMIFKY